MSKPSSRRDFLKSATLAGASIAIVHPVSGEMFPPDDSQIKNSFFTISFDRAKGVFGISRSNGAPLIFGGAARINLSKTEKLSTADRNYRHTIDSKAFTDPLGTGKKLIVSSRARNEKIDVETHLSLYDQLNAFTMEVVARNVSREDLTVHAISTDGGTLHVAGVSKCLTNGEMYFDTGTLHEFEKIEGPIHSWWNVAFFSGYDQEGLVIGYLENNSCLGNLVITKTDNGQPAFVAESVYGPLLTLKPGAKMSSNRVMIALTDNPYAALETYASAAGKMNHARTNSVVNGWCSWFYTLARVSESEVIANTEFAAKHLKPFGLEYIQVDEGYQRWHGDWEGNQRFPHGMKWLADKIKSHGFKAGLWISPYVISEPTEVFQKHKDWLVKSSDGSPQRVGNWAEGTEPPSDENPRRYCLDITHPEAAKWLHQLIDAIVNDWGYEMIKIDFVAWSILAAQRYHDPTQSSAQVYRKGMEIIRKAAGNKCHILECGPGATTVGLIDSMRIELDVNYGFNEIAWSTYFTNPACSASAAAKRYYFHKRTWINDVDHVCLHHLDNQQSEAAATIVALSGGNMFSGDRLTQLDPYKLEILKKITPSLGEAAIPIDLFDTDMPGAFALKIRRPFGEWTVVGFFNKSLTESIERNFSLSRLWLDPSKTYVAFDFWKQQFIGEIKNEIRLTIQPGSVTLLAVYEKSDRPHIISTDRHVSQGAVEIEDVRWDESIRTLSGTSVGPLNTSHTVSVYVPGKHPWTWSGSGLFRDYDSYSLKLMHENIIQVHVRFDRSEKVQWKVNIDEIDR